MPGTNGELRGPFSSQPAYRAEWLVNESTYFNQPRNIITLHPYTITTVNCTPAIVNVGGRPAVELAGAGAGTDGAQLQWGTAGLLLMAGKKQRNRFTFRSEDIVNHSFCAGIAVVDTTIIGSDPTNHVMLQKLTGSASSMKLRSRKASGTVEEIAIPYTFESSAWYDVELVIKPDLTTAGRALVDVYIGKNLSGGDAIPQICANLPISTQCPDTVATAATRRRSIYSPRHTWIGP